MKTHNAWRLRAGAAAMLLLVSLAGGAQVSERARHPNILWIVAENIGPDIGCYGFPTVATPNLDRLAREGMRYRQAFATAPVCSTSRSSFMTGMYQTSIGAHHHRSHRSPGIDDNYHLPAGVRPLTQRLMEAGYSTANLTTIAGKPVGTGKTDLNFSVEGPVLRPNEKPPGGSRPESLRHNFENSIRLFHLTEWTALRARQPFYAQINLPTVELGEKNWTAAADNLWNGQSHPSTTDPAKIVMPPYFPDHPIVRRHWAGYIDAVNGLDARVGEILARLETDGLADETIVIFFADNGRLELRGLDWCYDSGDRVPLIVRWPRNYPAPPQYHAGKTNEQLVSLIDLTATTLALAGIPKPAGMQGRIFLGDKPDPARDVVFSARDRTDEAVQRIRAARGPRFRYIRNFMPDKPYLAPHHYKDTRFPIGNVLREMNAAGRLSGPALALLATRLPNEELYDTESDPYEVRNLAASGDPVHQQMLREMRATLEQWIEEAGDRGREPEPAIVLEFWREAERRMFAPDARR